MGHLDSVEIFRDGPRMQSRTQVKEILRNASVVFSFENSSIVSEAILSGTPAYFVPNEFLGDIIAETELGNGGISKSDDPKDIARARKTIDEGIDQYYKKASDFLRDIEKFVALTQQRAKCEGFRIPIAVPNHSHFINQHRVGLARQILKNQGISTLFRVTYHFFMRRLSWRYWAGRERR